MDVVLAVLPRCLTMAAVYCQAIIPYSLDILRMYAEWGGFSHGPH